MVFIFQQLYRVDQREIDDFAVVIPFCFNRIGDVVFLAETLLPQQLTSTMAKARLIRSRIMGFVTTTVSPLGHRSLVISRNLQEQ